MMDSRLESGEGQALAEAPAVEIREMQSEADATAFRMLNEEWITRFFTLEKKDREILGDPEGLIVARGGKVFIVLANGVAVGAVALIRMEGGVYELSKMAVSPGLRGLGIGRTLLEYAIERAREMGAASLFLGSSTKLKSAVHLYESVGFRHVPPEDLPPMPYVRADVFMSMPL